MMALPPMVDAVNLQFFYAVIEEQLKTLPPPPQAAEPSAPKPRYSLLSGVPADGCASTNSANTVFSGFAEQIQERPPDESAMELSRHRQMIKGLTRRIDTLENQIRNGSTKQWSPEQVNARSREESDLTLDEVERPSAMLPRVAPEIVGNPGLQELQVSGEDA